jgi:AcrR family transcriptional regulator
MGRPQRVDDRALLDTARRVFLERGPATTTREVARAAGVSQAVLFQRFGSRDDLLLAALMPAPPDLGALLGDADEAQRLGPHDYLIEVGVRALEFFVGAAPAFLHLVVHPAFRREVFARVHEHVPLVALVAGLAGRLGEMQRAGLIGPGDPDAASEALIGFVHNAGVFAVLADYALTPTAARSRVAAFVDVLWHGLAPRPSSAL